MKRLGVLLALALLGSGCIGGGDTITVHAVFSDVGDLVPKAGVQSSDVRVGTVEKIALSGYNAKVTMSIYRGVSLPGNVRALIRSTSLLGEKFVDLAAPTGPAGRLQDGQTIPLARTAKVASLDDALLKLGQILEDGDVSDLGVFIHSTAEILDGKQQQLGDLFGELRTLTSTIASHAPELGAALDSLDSAAASLAKSELGGTVASSARVTGIIADQQKDLDALVTSLDTFASAAASYTSRTTDANDATLKNIRRVLDQVMLTTGDLDQALSALARYTDLWPKSIPGDYIQLDVVLESGSANGPASTPVAPTSVSDLRGLIWRPTR